MFSAFEMIGEHFRPWPSWQGIGGELWREWGLFWLLTVLMMSVVGLLAIWAGLGRGHWFLRTAVVLGCISLLLTIPAFELVIVYVLQAGLTIIILAAWRNWWLARAAAMPGETTPDAGRHTPWQFSILDMLLLMVVVAWVSAMLVQTPSAVWETWPSLVAEGAITAGLTIAAAWIGLGHGRWWLRLPLCLILFPAALMAAWLRLWRAAEGDRHTSQPSKGREMSQPPAGSPWRFSMTYVSRAVLIVLSLAILAPVVGVCRRLAHHWTFAEPARPSPNGYDELVRAGHLIKNVNDLDFETATRAELKTNVAQCSPVYVLVRAALDKPCVVPVRLDDTKLTKTFPDLQSLRRIARALYARGRLAAMEGRNKEAIACHIDTIRLGRAAMKDGGSIDMLVGISIEGTGRSGLNQMRSSLSAEECLSLIPKLSDLLGDSAWCRQVF